jgi:hypothetical protein
MVAVYRIPRKWNENMSQANPYLDFIKKSVNEIFHNDTNFAIGDFHFFLYYPTIEVQHGNLSKFIDCKIGKLKIKPDSYSIVKFLSEYPEFCQSIID